MVAHGDFTMLLEDDERVYAFTRRLDDVELLVVGNFSGEPAAADVPGWDGAELLLSNCLQDGAALQPWEARVYKRTITPSPGASASTSPS